MIGLPWMRIIVVLALLTLLAAGTRKFYNDIRATAKLEGRTEAIEEMRVKIDAQKAEAAALFKAEQDKATAAERQLRAFKDEQEVKDVGARKRVDELSARLRAAGRLRDPNAPTDSGCGPSRSGPESAVAAAAGAGRDDRAETGGLLSVQLSDLLQRLLREADEVNNAYASCRPYVQRVRDLKPGEP